MPGLKHNPDCFVSKKRCKVIVQGRSKLLVFVNGGHMDLLYIRCYYYYNYILIKLHLLAQWRYIRSKIAGESFSQNKSKYENGGYSNAHAWRPKSRCGSVDVWLDRYFCQWRLVRILKETNISDNNVVMLLEIFIMAWKGLNWFENALSAADPGFPRGRGGANSRGGCANLLFGQFLPKTAWKWRKFGPQGGACVPRLPM